MPPIAATGTTLLTAQASTTTVEVVDSADHKFHSIYLKTTGGAWTGKLVCYPDGSTAVDLSDELSLASGESGVIDHEGWRPGGVYLVATRTGGTLDAWSTQYNEASGLAG